MVAVERGGGRDLRLIFKTRLLLLSFLLLDCDVVCRVDVIS